MRGEARRALPLARPHQPCAQGSARHHKRGSPPGSSPEPGSGSGHDSAPAMERGQNRLLSQQFWTGLSPGGGGRPPCRSPDCDQEPRRRPPSCLRCTLRRSSTRAASENPASPRPAASRWVIGTPLPTVHPPQFRRRKFQHLSDVLQRRLPRHANVRLGALHDFGDGRWGPGCCARTLPDRAPRALIPRRAPWPLPDRLRANAEPCASLCTGLLHREAAARSGVLMPHMMAPTYDKAQVKAPGQHASVLARLLTLRHLRGTMHPWAHVA